MNELHVGTFSSKGTFEGIVDRLDHVKDLRVNADEIMRIDQFSGEINGGYAEVYPFAVQDSYGSLYGLKGSIEPCYKEGVDSSKKACNSPGSVSPTTIKSKQVIEIKPTSFVIYGKESE